jgi:hypothetical protein
MQIVTRNIANENFPYDIDVIAKGRRLLTSSRFEELDQLVVQLRTAEFNLCIKFATESEVSEFEEVVALDDRLHLEELQCVAITEQTFVDVCVKVPSTAPCTMEDSCECTPLPANQIPEFESPTGLCIYSGPGNGKTTLISGLDSNYRGIVRDTDHMRIGESVPPRSILFTNRSDVFRSFPGVKICHLPHRNVWLERCRTKCENCDDKWYSDVLACVGKCFILYSDCYLTDLIDLRTVFNRRKLKFDSKSAHNRRKIKALPHPLSTQ